MTQREEFCRSGKNSSSLLRGREVHRTMQPLISNWLPVYILLVVTTYAAISPLEHQQCTLDPILARLASKVLSVDDILTGSARPRQCVVQTSLRQTDSGPPKTRLIYVTPWNKDGYAYTTLHAEKLSFVAPVWYQIKLSGASVALEGGHDVNTTWLSSLSSFTQVVPRFDVQFASKKEVEAILFFPRNEADMIVKKIVDEVKQRGYSGATLEVPYAAQMTALIKKLGLALHALDKKLILVIPAHHNLDDISPFGRHELLDLQDFVDHFSLNAYDHATALGTDSGNAPLPWTRHILDEILSPRQGALLGEDDDPFGDDIFETSKEIFSTSAAKISPLKKKLLLGLNFYGFTCTSDGVMNTITAEEYTSLVAFSKMGIPLTVDWDEVQGEHRMDGKIWSIWYPTLLSLLNRLALAEEYGVGVSVWEAGQGLEYFWDVL